MFTDEGIYKIFTQVMQQTAINNRDPLQVASTHNGSEKTPIG